MGNYVSGTNYGLNDAVSYGGSTYISLVAGNHGNAPDLSPAFWAVLAAQGPVGPAGAAGATGPAGPAGVAGATGAAGPQGPPVTFQGGWLNGTTYALGDVVGYGGSSYVALVGNVGREPDVSPVYWALLAQAGRGGACGGGGTAGVGGAYWIAGACRSGGGYGCDWTGGACRAGWGCRASGAGWACWGDWCSGGCWIGVSGGLCVGCELWVE